jgi:hypothetical protein
MILAGSDAMFIEMTIFNLYPALLAGLATAADALDLYAQLAGGVQYQSAMLDLAATARRHQNEGVFVIELYVSHADNKRRQTSNDKLPLQ